MTGIYGSHPEDRYFAGELSEYFGREEQSELEAEAIEEQVKFSMERGQEFDPYHPENFGEALAQLGDNEVNTLSSFVGAAMDAGLKNDHTNHAALCCLKLFVENYYKRVAEANARGGFNGR